MHFRIVQLVRPDRHCWALCMYTLLSHIFFFFFYRPSRHHLLRIYNIPIRCIEAHQLNFTQYASIYRIRINDMIRSSINVSYLYTCTLHTWWYYTYDPETLLHHFLYIISIHNNQQQQHTYHDLSIFISASVWDLKHYKVGIGWPAIQFKTTLTTDYTQNCSTLNEYWILLGIHMYRVPVHYYYRWLN